MFERTRQSAWLDAVTTQLTRSEWIFCTKTPLFGESWATKFMAKKIRKCSLRRATNVMFWKIRGWRRQKKIAPRQIFWNRASRGCNSFVNSGPKILRCCFIHWSNVPFGKAFFRSSSRVAGYFSVTCTLVSLACPYSSQLLVYIWNRWIAHDHKSFQQVFCQRLFYMALFFGCCMAFLWALLWLCNDSLFTSVFYMSLLEVSFTGLFHGTLS